MLSNVTAATPRPRPPAQARRSASISLKNSASPPPLPCGYALPFPSQGAHKPSLDTLLGSPMSETVQMVGWAVSGKTGEPATPDVFNDKSRDEISELLMKADGLIKERENDLSLTSAARKSLCENNVALKTKHQALLARIPSTPSESKPPSPMPTVTPLSQTPHYYSASLPRATTDSYAGNTSASRFLANERRARKISVSHADIALLSDQNAELLQKLEKLESESAQADQAGRRVLKRLEREIQDLRDELDKAQAKGEELEEKAKAGFGLGAEKVVEEAWRKKKEREAKVRAMRYKYGPDHTSDENEETGVRDFAPGGALSSGPPSDFSLSPSSKRREPGLPTSPSSDLVTTEEEEVHQLSSSPRRPRKQTTAAYSVPQPEYALISQLLLKIRELEEANVQIIEQQAETANKLQAMQKETESISKVYECLGDQSGIEWELIVDGEGEASKPSQKSPGDNTIRFKSLRRTLDGNAPGITSDGGVDESQKSDPALLNIAPGHKARKSVVGLFNTPTPMADTDANVPDKPKLSIHPLPLPTSPLANDGQRQVSWSTNNGIPSPALSSLSLTTPQSQCELPITAGRTLESELGSELGNDWGLNGGNHRLRTTSLYSLSHLSISPSPSPSPLPANRLLFPSVEDEPAGPDTPTIIADRPLQLSVEPPSPQSNDEGASSFWQGKHSARYRRMSQTIRSRTSRWVDGRFKDTLLGETTAPESIIEEGQRMPKQSNAMSGRLAGALDAMRETFAGRTVSSQESVAQNPGLGSPRPAPLNALELHVEHATVTSAVEKKRPVAVKFMIELWIWFQFAIIILVFLWSMAKRGPKSVLNEADKKRALSMRQ